jgi:putative transposase
MRYRRANVAGGTYFFTVNLVERKRTLLVDHVDVLRAVIQKVKAMHRFQIDAIVILPDHLRAVWTPRVGDCDYATCWTLIKVGFSRGLAKDERRHKSRIATGERGIWERQYWGHVSRDARDYVRHVAYVHYNTMKHGHIERVGDWPYASFRRLVA